MKKEEWNIPETKLINFNVPVKLLEELDSLIPGNYGDRTDALCSATRNLVAELRSAPKRVEDLKADLKAIQSHIMAMQDLEKRDEALAKLAAVCHTLGFETLED